MHDGHTPDRQTPGQEAPDQESPDQEAPDQEARDRQALELEAPDLNRSRPDPQAPRSDRPGIWRIEEASLRVWPAIEDEGLDGWRLRFSDGFSKRANSVQPLAGSQLPFGVKIDYCEAWYAERHQPCTFRLTPLSEAGLREELVRRGYGEVDRTAVLERSPDASTLRHREMELRAADMEEWLRTFADMSGMRWPPPRALRRILESDPKDRLFAALWSSAAGGPVACGMAAASGGLVGLFDLVTAPAHRRVGFGSELVLRLIEWARGMGAEAVYLQVLTRNTPAWGLYEKLRFRRSYEYSYWMRRP